VVEVERATNPFLRAQKGLFVLDLELGRGQNTPSLSLDERTAGSDATIVKLTMPMGEASRALELLALEGIDRPHLMPTYDNVVTYLRQLGSSRLPGGS
jgi:hypothetical protein